MWRLCKQFLLFLRQEKKWWLIPLVGVLLGLAALILLSGGSVLAPLMYPFR
jgi:4-amino-4-deoxy-L-arabinose transferase-like glycosyltransferase